jgi:FXSXX-COOH protein
MNNAADQPTGGDLDAGLPAVGEYDFRSLVDSRDTVLARALARLAREIDSDVTTVVAGFGNFAPDGPEPDDGSDVAL